MEYGALKNFESKFKYLSRLVLIVFAVLLIRLWQLQIMEGSAIMVKSRQNQTRVVRINAPRGMIYDRKGKILATSQFSHHVSVVPEDIEDKPEELALLCKILKLTPAELRTKLQPNPKYPRSDYQYVPIMKNLDPDTVIRLKEAQLNLAGVEVDEVPIRFYPYRELGCHLFGYTREIDLQELLQLRDKGYHPGDPIGKTGLERTYEDFLRGSGGGKIYEADIHGRPLRLLENREPVPGYDLHLTIDLKLQAAAEKALDAQLAWLQKYTPWKNAKSGAVLALDPRNGDILAMVSKPGFDPNWFSGVMSREVADSIYQNPLHPLTNRTIQGEFAPGSTFKPLTVLSALMEHKVTLDDQFYCNGFDPVYGQNFKCWTVTNRFGPKAHFRENVIDGLKNSCNIVMGELSSRVGPEILSKYSRAFGLGKPTGLQLYPGEASGLVPDPEWKRKHTREKTWFDIETKMFGIGQTYLTVTPLQLAQVYAALANRGKLYRPRLVSKITSAAGRPVAKFAPQVVQDLKLPPDVQAIIQEGLMEVIGDGGTAASAFRGFPIERYPIAGKTGTAQKPPYDNSGVFACYAPARRPRIVIVVFVEQGGSGSGGAAPIARKILEAYFHLDKPLRRPLSAPPRSRVPQPDSAVNGVSVPEPLPGSATPPAESLPAGNEPHAGTAVPSESRPQTESPQPAVPAGDSPGF
jgi:penicillin-binding protein 2